MATRSGKKAAAQRDWAAEQERFLAEIAPESHFHRAFDGLGDVFFFAKNLAGETLFFSRGILPHVGLHDYEQMLGATDEDLTPGPFAAHYRADDRAVIESRKPLIGHVDLWFDEIGLPDWYETNKYPLLDRSGWGSATRATSRSISAATPASRRRPLSSRPMLGDLPCEESDAAGKLVWAATDVGTVQLPHCVRLIFRLHDSACWRAGS